MFSVGNFCIPVSDDRGWLRERLFVAAITYDRADLLTYS